MNSAKTVYILICVLILIPVIIRYVKRISSHYKREGKLPANKLIMLIVITALIITVIYFHYNFTIWYQAPLVAERAGQLFNSRLAGEMNLPSYLETMQEKGLSDDQLITVSGEELETAGFRQQKYDLSISVRTYELKDNQVIIYFRHSTENDKRYSYVKLKKENYRWKVIEHRIISADELAEIKPKVNFD